MASTYSALKIQLMTTGENSGTWGNVTNINLGTALEEAIVGSANVTFSSADVTLTLSDTNTSQTARNLRLNLTGTVSAAQNLVVPAIEKVYLVNNGLSYAITVKNSTGTGIAVPAGKTMWVYNNGTNVVDAVTHLTSLTLAAALPVTSGGTGVTTSTGSGNVVLSTSPTLVSPALGTPTSATLTNCTGLPVSTGISGLGTNVATFLATPSSANLASAVSDETGTGALVFANTPTLVTPVLGTPTSGTLTNCTGLPVSTGISGLGTNVATFLATPSSANLAAAVTNETGSGALVFATSPTLVTPALGTPSSGTLTSCTGLPLTTGVTGTLPVANGGTGVTTSTGTGNVVLSASPTLTGTPIAPTAANGTNTTQIATTAFVTNSVTIATGSLGTMSTQNANAVAITGGTINSLTVTSLGTNSYGTRTVSTSAPTGGSNGDIWYQY